MIRRSISAFIFATALLAPLTSGATIACAGLITYLAVDQGGQVSIGGAMPINAVCSLEAQGIYSATATACKAMYATLLTAKVAGKSLTVYYSDPALTSCGSITQWSTQRSMYFVESPT